MTLAFGVWRLALISPRATRKRIAFGASISFVTLGTERLSSASALSRRLCFFLASSPSLPRSTPRPRSCLTVSTHLSPLRPCTPDTYYFMFAQQAEAIGTLMDLRSKISTQQDFAEIAQEHSDCGSARSGGDLGEFGDGQMMKVCMFEPRG